MLWKHTLSHATARIKAGGDALVEAEQLISGTIEWADWVVETRKEDKALWFSGEKWVELMDFWIGLGKKVRIEIDTLVVDNSLWPAGQVERH